MHRQRKKDIYFLNQLSEEVWSGSTAVILKLFPFQCSKYSTRKCFLMWFARVLVPCIYRISFPILRWYRHKKSIRFPIAVVTSFNVNSQIAWFFRGKSYACCYITFVEHNPTRWIFQGTYTTSNSIKSKWKMFMLIATCAWMYYAIRYNTYIYRKVFRWMLSWFL